MEDSYQKPHAIMISFPLQGHITPFVHLALNLASKGFTITFVHTQSTHHHITQSGSEPDIFAGARNSGLDIRYRTITDGLPVEFDRSLHRDRFWKAIGDIFPSHVDQLVGEIVGSGQVPAPSCLVSDTFYVWPAAVAEKYNLVNVSFWSEAAMVFCLYYHLDLLIENGHIGNSGNKKEAIDYIPGIDIIQKKDLMSHIQDNDMSKVVEMMSYKAFKLVKNADFILCNTVQELESKTILALHQNQLIYAIGPIFPLGFTKTTVATHMWFESDCTQWLDARPRGSVLYVSFGSYAHTSKDVIAEIAHGLLLSGVNFIWAIRSDIVSSNDTDFLPVGFEVSIQDRGLIVPWCRQTDVISHPAVGGFLTHCGWNSILEGIWCSIPFICYPLVSDQLTNRKLVIDDWTIGINLCDDELVTRDEVSKKINYLMSGKTSGDLRKKIKKVRETLQNALATDGSSKKLFDQFIEDLKVKIQKRCGIVTKQ